MIASRLLLILVVFGMVGCALSGVPGSSNSKSAPHQTAVQVRATAEQGATRLASASTQLDEIQQAFTRLARRSGPAWRVRGYLTATENDQMETLLFKFVTARDVLSEMVTTLGGRHASPAFRDDSVKAAAHVLTIDAQFVLIRHSAELVAEFAGDRVAIAKLNEAIYESHIPTGSYQKLHLNVTAVDLEKRMDASWTLLEHDLQELSATRNEIVRQPAFQDLIQRAPEDYRRAKAAVSKARGQGLGTAVKNVMTHAEAAKVARELGAGWGDLAYSGRSLLFKTVSRMKNPEAKVIKFSPGQHAQVQSLILPGDIILTYTAGYMSDVFIPGAFKHGITFVGTPGQRKAIGVDASKLPAMAAPEKAAVQQRILQGTLSDGQKADVIEAVAEGVIFNNLDHIMDTHVNRIAILRPRLDASERAAFITEVFAYQGDAYDFLFDFADASRQVCTEVIYRGLDGKRNIRFSLTKRGGHPTLSADDVVNYHFKTNGRHFDFILFGEEDFSRSGHHARVLTGPVGETRLRELMVNTNHPRP